MFESLTRSFSAAGFLPHGYCFQWTPSLLWAYVLSDSLIALAYYTIPGALWFFVRKRTDLPFNWIFLMFALFILACGTTHAIGVLNIWQPVYWLDASLKVLTAAVSVATAILLWPLIPKALRLPSQSQLVELNRTLEIEIAERRRAEARAQELAASLELKVAELKRSNEALERSNIDLQRFAYVVSHDLQTPMRSVASFTGLLQSTYADKFDAQGQDWMRRTVEAVKYLQTLVRDLLDYSRIESETRRFERVEFRDVVDDAVSLLDASVRESGAQIDCDELPAVTGDRSQLVQLILNLVGNGIKYRGADPPRIRVSAEHTGNHWTFAVKDNGIGIAAQYYERIFEVFQRLHGQREYPGTGIGLAICRRVVGRHGGKIWVESEPGRGSVFYFTIPETAALAA